MSMLRVLTATEQVAAHLRDELFRNRWLGKMPGSHQLAKELGVGHSTIEAALGLLETEGLLIPQGTGRRRRISLPSNSPSPALRIAVLNHDPVAKNQEYIVEMLHRLARQGQTPLQLDKTLAELRMDPSRIARLVTNTDADAWIVESGNRKVLDWFVEREIPLFSLFGACHGMPIAGIRLDHEAVLTAFRRLLHLGHRRIVFLTFQGRRRERPGPLWRTMIEELESHGVRTGPYNMPEWKNTREGFRQLLDSLFGITPPTALMIEEAPHLIAALQFCGRRGLRVPEDVSLICLEESAGFNYCTPPVAHVRWDYRPIIRRAVRWADHIARGKDDRRLSIAQAEFVEGETIARVKGANR